MTPRISFVSGPSSVPNVLLDMSDTGTVLAQDFNLGSPIFEAAPDSVGGVYGFRRAGFRLQVSDDGYSGVSTALQSVSRQLLAARNWLMIQWEPASEPMFLRTYRTAQESLEWENAGAGIWELPVSLECDPFLCGAREDIAAHVVRNALTGVDVLHTITGVKGDAPAPTVVWTPDTDVAMSVFVGCSTTAPVFIEAETGTNGSNTTSVTATATYSNSAGKLFTPGGTGSGSRITALPVPAGTSGTFRVFARVKKSVGAGVFSGSVTVGVTNIEATRFVTQTSTEFQVVDMGRLSMPAETVGWTDLTAAATTLTFLSGRDSGSGTLGIDWFALVSAEGESTTQGYSLSGAATGALVMDSRFNNSFLTAAASGPFDPAAAAAFDNTIPRGGFPRLWPGVTNYLTFVRLDPIPLATTTTVNVSYWPQYMQMRPDGT